MGQTEQIENYLSKIEGRLARLPASLRAEKVLEVRQKIEDLLARYPNRSVDTILSEVGSPKKAADRILSAEGRYVTNGKPSVLKWLLIAFLGGTGLLLAFVAFLIFMFSPIIEINEETGDVSFFGGMVDIQDMNGSFMIGREEVFDGDTNTHRVSTSGHLETDNIRSVIFNFSNGDLKLKGDEGSRLSWSCEVTSKSGRVVGLITEVVDGVEFNLSHYRHSDCTLTVPNGLKFQVIGGNGKGHADGLLSDFSLNLSNGNVKFSPAETSSYVYNLEVTNGVIDDRAVQSQPGGYSVDISVANGRIVID